MADPTVRQADFQADPAAVIRRALDVGRVSLVNEAGETVAILGFPKDRREVIGEGSYELDRAVELRDQARAKADRFRVERDEALRREAAVSRELARALAKIEQLRLSGSE